MSRLALSTVSSFTVAFLALALAGCECDVPVLPDSSITLVDSGVDGGDAGMTFRDGSGIGNTDFVLERVVPDHGPYSGGNTVVLRGNGFTDLSQVTFGDIMVQPADHRLIDPRRLAVVVPAGAVGTVDVTIEVDGETRTLTDGYTYEPIYVEPNSGSIAGGTFVSIIGNGTTFQAGDSVLFGRLACTDIDVVSETRITCRTPPSVAGTVDVTVVDGVDMSETVAHDAFTYFDSSDPFSGGLGGGPINGAINLTAIDATTGQPVPDAFAILGEDLTTVHQGLTDTLGQITFSGPDVIAPETIHVAKFCYERTSVIAFDASDVTVFLVPWQDPMCGDGGEPPPPGRGRNGAIIQGELIFFGPMEMGPNPWLNVPEPIDGWVRVAYVETTRRQHNVENPDPSGGGTQHNRVLETDMTGPRGYPYSIFARPAGLAVYALAGLENTTTGHFIPYVMGVARNVLAGPGQTVEHVDIEMTIPLDHYLETEVTELPRGVETGPDRMRLQANIDLGGEGVIHRVVNFEEIDVLRRRDATRSFRFTAQPSLEGALSDGRFRVEAGWYTSDLDNNPYTVVVQNGVTTIDSVLPMNGFLGIPEATAPAFADPLPPDRILRWEADPSAPDPDMHMVLMIGADGNPAWRMFLPGDVREAPAPDLSSIPMIDDIPGGFFTWGVFAISIPGFTFDEFRYQYLNDIYWSHSALDVWLGQR
ncbi:MAG: IPT/TIG domain-containing protein [Sandaracinaceae bacterium]